MAVNRNTNRIYVTNSNGKRVWVIDGDTNTIVKTVMVGDWPQSVAVNTTTNHVFVVNSGSNSVSVIGGFSNTVLVR